MFWHSFCHLVACLRDLIFFSSKRKIRNGHKYILNTNNVRIDRHVSTNYLLYVSVSFYILQGESEMKKMRVAYTTHPKMTRCRLWVKMYMTPGCDQFGRPHNGHRKDTLTLTMSFNVVISYSESAAIYNPFEIYLLP